MTQAAGIVRRGTLAIWAAIVWRRASKVAAVSAAWARAERHAFFSRPSAGAFHGEQPPTDGYLTQVRSTWGRP